MLTLKLIDFAITACLRADGNDLTESVLDIFGC